MGYYPDLPNSNFPTSLDDFPRMQDISASDVALMKQYQNYILQGDVVKAQEIITKNPSLKPKIFNADNLNNIGDAVKGVQRFFKSNVDGYIQQKQTEFDAKVDEFAIVGSYNSVTIYKNKNMLYYNTGDGDKLYLCITPNENGVSGVLPLNTTHFRVLTAQGEKGEAGVGLTYAGEWTNTKTYVHNSTQTDCVFYGGMLFACLQTNTGQQPSLANSTQYWGRAMGNAVVAGDTKGYRIITTSTNTVNFIVGTITTYNPNTDYLEVHMDGKQLIEGVDYSISSDNTSVVSKTGNWVGTTSTPIKFNFFVERNMINNLVFSDGGSIGIGTIPLNRLVQGVQNDINKITTLETNINNLTTQLNTANQTITTLQNTINTMQNTIWIA